MNTIAFTPAFFLVHKDLVIKITKKTIIGRSQGDVILEDNTLLSAAHCEIRMNSTECFIKDLKSTNGVYINQSRILPDEEVELHVGDKVKLGNTEYIFFADEKEVKKAVPPPDRRKGSRPENLYTLKNIINFYSANSIYRGIYFVTLSIAVVSAFLHLKVDTQVPLHLDFLNKLYSEQIIFSGIQLVFMVWLLSLIHSLGMVLYLNRNPVRQGMGLAIYFVFLFNVANFINGPMGDLKGYLVEREAIENLKIDTSAISHLKNITAKKAALTQAYNVTLKKLPKEQQDVLGKDFREVIQKADHEIKKISLN